MIPAVTREEHYYALRNNVDPLGYCKNLFYDKTKSTVPESEFFSKLNVWFSRQAHLESIRQRKVVNIGMLQGCETIKKFYSEKFA